jgi:hypothetical protein
MVESPRGWAQPFIHWLAPGLSSINEGIRALKNIGLSYHNQTMRKDIHNAMSLYSVRSSTIRPDPYSGVEKDDLKGMYWDKPYNYRTYGFAQVKDVVSGEVEERYVSFYHNYNLDEETEADQLENIWMFQGSDPSMKVVGFERWGTMERLGGLSSK